MSRSGYHDDDGDDDQWAQIRWRGAVASAMRGKKGQAFLKECLAALEAMPEKALAAHTYEVEGEYCTLGVLGKHRGIDLSRFDPEYFDESYEKDFGVNSKVLREIIWENDTFSGGYDANGNWLGQDIRREKFGPPKHARRHISWQDRFYYVATEDMTYTVPRPELPYERHTHMVKWLKEKIKENE